MSASRVVRKPDIAWRAIEDEALLVDSRSGLIYPLNAVGARVWQMLDGTHTGSQICAAIDEEFEGDKASLRQDIDEFIARLVSQGLASPV